MPCPASMPKTSGRVRTGTKDQKLVAFGIAKIGAVRTRAVLATRTRSPFVRATRRQCSCMGFVDL